MVTKSPPSDVAAKSRIIAHMNADHQDSLIRYLQHYAHLSSFSARNARITDITFSSLTIQSSPSSSHTIPISPPMQAWNEARPRVVAMDAECCEALGKSNITVKRYKPPRGFMVIVMVAVILTTLIYSRRANFEEGSWTYDYLFAKVPSFAEFSWRIQPWLWYPMVVLHAGEVWWLERTRLQRYTVRMGSRVWWLWIVSCFFEGFGAFVRFDEVVGEEEERKAKAKH